MAQAPSADGDAGYEVIPASRRPDGTWRKEIKVKAGYVPPDEVAKYESKGKRFMNEKPTLPPGFNPVEGQPTKKLTKNQKKNERKKQQRKEKAAESAENEKNIPMEKKMSELNIDTASATSTSESASDVNINPGLLKKIRAVRKKIKHCEQLEAKKANGETLEKEQLEKLSKRKEFQKELEDLESQIDN